MNDPRAALNTLDPQAAAALTDKHGAVLEALADLLWPIFRDRIADHVQAIVADKINSLDRPMIEDMIEQYVNDHELMTSDEVADRLSEYVEEGNFEDKVNDWAQDNIEGLVREAVRELSFTVEVN
jgi:hypothetical protein